MKLLKFGGKSLANGENLNNVLNIIKSKLTKNELFYIVLSARGNSTDHLENLLDKAVADENIDLDWEAFKAYQLVPLKTIDFSSEFELLNNIFKGVQLTKDYSNKTKDLVLAQGELLSTKLISKLLNNDGFNTKQVDSRLFLKTDDNFGNAAIIAKESKQLAKSFFKNFTPKTTPIITGFIASNIKNETTTLGRNGSNYSASLIANYLNANEVLSYTHINGIFTANPDIVEKATILNQLNYTEANELASFGASILHSKTISPLESKNIPLRILNTTNTNSKGTLINNKKQQKEIKAISIQKEIGIINIIGKEMLGEKGIDSKKFSSLEHINIGVISQGSSERGVSFIVPQNELNNAIKSLKKAFYNEINTGKIESISSIKEVSIISIIGQKINNFHSSIAYLNQNNIDILLINNTIHGSNISIILHNKDIIKAVNIIHSQIFGAAKNIHLALFGIGAVGDTLINQLLKSKESILKRKQLKLKIIAIANSKKVLLNKNGIENNWQKHFTQLAIPNTSIDTIINYATKHHLENLIAIDNTSSVEFIKNYIPLVNNGFDLISSNKLANTQDYQSYKKLRQTTLKNQKQYLYETNVGAGLPIIDTIKILHESGENITQIKGVFSGSISYIFNQFSESDKPFSHHVLKAMQLGLTEPDPREDLYGNDVARKLLILARELNLENEFDDIIIEGLVTKNLRSLDKQEFLDQITKLDNYFEKIKKAQKTDHVLRYVGILSGDLQKQKGNLNVQIISVPKNSTYGNLKKSDSIIEIFTENYSKSPITIIGAGAGAAVTARGVFGDIIRISTHKLSL